MAYELWESTGGNIIAEFRSRDAALEAVRTTLESSRRSNVHNWLLIHEDEEGEITHIAAGTTLIDLARATPA